MGHSPTAATSWEKGKLFSPSFVCFGHLVCHWKAKLTFGGFFFFLAISLYEGNAGVTVLQGQKQGGGWEDVFSSPRTGGKEGGLQSKLKHLLRGKWEMFFFFVVFSDLPYVFSYLFITLSIISRSTYPTNDAWKFQQNKSKGANLAAPHLSARLPSSSVTTQTPSFVRSSRSSWKRFWKLGNQGGRQASTSPSSSSRWAGCRRAKQTLTRSTHCLLSE